MKTTLLSKVLIVLLCSVSFITTHAQGLSLSFNLSETDTLSNMIADSKKYDISSLTLSGYVNDVNTQYIQDLNLKGNLNTLDLTDLKYISAKGQVRKASYTFKKTEYYQGHHHYSHDIIDFLKAQHYPDNIDLSDPWWGLDNDTLVITDIYDEDNIIRTFSGFQKQWTWTPNYNRTIILPFSNTIPKRIFDINSFSRFCAPFSLNIIGGVDCSYRVKSCNEYVVGKNVKQIGDNAFYDSHIGNIILHSTIDSIGAHAFENCSGNVSSDILANVTMLGDNAFKNSTCLNDDSKELHLKANKIGCSAFQNATMPSNINLQNVEEIGPNAFMGVNIKHIEIGNNCQILPDSVFANCLDLEYIKGCQSVKSIGNYAFGGCKSLKEHSPLNSLQSLGCYAFANCSVLSYFVAPNSLTSIGEYAFYNSGVKNIVLGDLPFRKDMVQACNRLESVEVSNSNKVFQSKEGVIFSKDGETILFYPYGKTSSIYELPNSVIEIADSAFYDVNKLGALVISENVSKIGKNAFGNSSVLELKVLPSTTPKVTDNISGLEQSLVRLFVHEKDYSTYYIANYWGDFKNIFVLEKTVSPDNLINVEVAGTLPNYIGFGNQFKYNSLRLSGKLNGDDVRYLREMAGRDVNGKETAGVLTNLDFSQASIVKGGDCYYKKNEYSSGKLTTAENEIGESMFEGCKFTNLAISESTTKIGNNALNGCPLESFKLPAATQTLSLNSFFGMTTLKEFIVDSDNSNYMSLDGVLFTKNGKALLLYPYSKQGERYTTPETTTNIGEQAFSGSNLKIVTTNEGLIEIGAYAFDNLWALEAVSLPSTLETIGHRAFWGCNNLTSVTCNAYYPPTLKYDSYSYYGQPYNNFSDKTYENAILSVPKKNGGYKNKSGWKLFKNIFEEATGIINISGADNCKIVNSYSINGQKANNSFHGVNILRMSDGTTKKVVVK